MHPFEKTTQPIFEKMNQLLIVFFVVLLFVACEEKPDKVEPEVVNYTCSGCLKTKSTMDTDQEYVTYTYEAGNQLKLTHTNAHFNCCPGDAGIITDVELSGDSIMLNEYELEGQCKCMCPYELTTLIGPLLFREYWIMYSTEGQETVRFKINFRKGLSGEIEI